MLEFSSTLVMSRKPRTQLNRQSETSRNQDEIKAKSASADNDTYNATLDKANFYKTQSDIQNDLANKIVEGGFEDFNTTFDELLQASTKTVTDAIGMKFTSGQANVFSEELQSNVLNVWSYNLPNDDITYTIDNESVEMDSTMINVIKKSIMSYDYTTLFDTIKEALEEKGIKKRDYTFTEYNTIRDQVILDLNLPKRSKYDLTIFDEKSYSYKLVFWKDVHDSANSL